MTKIWNDFERAISALDPDTKYLRVAASREMGISAGVFSSLIKDNILFRAYFRPERVGERMMLYRGEDIIQHLRRVQCEPLSTLKLLSDFYFSDSWDYPQPKEYVFQDGCFIEPIGGCYLPSIGGRG